MKKRVKMRFPVQRIHGYLLVVSAVWHVNEKTVDQRLRVR